MPGCINTMKENSVVEVGEVAIYVCWKIHWWVANWEKKCQVKGLPKENLWGESMLGLCLKNNEKGSMLGLRSVK